MHLPLDMSDKKEEGLHASTSKMCKWNMPRKRKLSPKPSQDLVFKKHKFSGDHDFDQNTTNFPIIRRKANLQTVKPVHIPTFCQHLRECAPNAALLLTCEQSNTEHAEPIKIDNLHDIPFMYSDKVNNAKDILSNISLI